MLAQVSQVRLGLVTVKNGQPIVEVGYHRSHGRTTLGIEVVRSRDVRDPARGGAPELGAHRLNFHELVLVAEGHAEHEVDFVSHPCSPGTLLWVRPGQVQRHFVPKELDAWIVWFTPDFPPPLPDSDRLLSAPFAPVRHQLDEPELARHLELVGQLADESARSAADADLLRHLLAALLLRIRRLPMPADTLNSYEAGETFTLFLRELEESYARTRRVEDYAARLGYTPKTLTRACLAATGHSAKRVIDDRVVLEAKRLLTHTDWTVASISSALGFAEATNFSKFFVRNAGTAPLEFRRNNTGAED